MLCLSITVAATFFLRRKFSSGGGAVFRFFVCGGGGFLDNMASMPCCTVVDVGEGNSTADGSAPVTTVTDRSATDVVFPRSNSFDGDEVFVK